MNREAGFYWVKSNGRWTIGEYEGKHARVAGFPWWVVGGPDPGKDSDFEAIGDRIETPPTRNT